MTENIRLHIIEGPREGQDLAVDGPAVIGRDPASAGVVLDDPEASRRHASLIPKGPSVDVEDLGSTNGTFVNGARLEESRVLVPGDRLRIGTTVMEVVAGDGQPSARLSHDDEPAEAEEESEPSPALAAVSGGSPDSPPGPDDPADPPEPAVPDAAPAAPGEGAVPPPPPAPAEMPPDAPAGGYGAPAGGQLAPQGGGGIHTRDAVVEWLLCLFVPFYGVYWFHRASKEMQAWSGGRIDYNAAATLTSLLIGWIVIIPPIVSYVSFCGRVRAAEGMAGVEQRASFWGAFWRALLFGYVYKWFQDQFNEVAPRQAG